MIGLVPCESQIGNSMQTWLQFWPIETVISFICYEIPVRWQHLYELALKNFSAKFILAETFKESFKNSSKRNMCWEGLKMNFFVPQEQTEWL